MASVAPTPTAPTADRRNVLARRRLEHVPVDGPGSPSVRQQGRQLSDDPAAIADLISSIGAVGVINPILCERDADGTLWLVAGERRLAAARHLVRNHPHNPTLADGIPALVVPGPLTELERRDWQIIENVARHDLTPGELARALLLDRCALLTQRMQEQGIPIPDTAATIANPADRFRALDDARVQAGGHHVGAPWEDVIERLGLELSKSRAQQVVRAFAEIPEDITSEMDAERVTLNSRMGWSKLARTRAEIAKAIWKEVTDRNRPDLLPSAVDAALQDPSLDAQEAVDAAIRSRVEANHARQEAVRARNNPPPDHDDDDSDGPHPVPVHPNQAVIDPSGNGSDDHDPGTAFDATALIREAERAAAALRNGASLDSRHRSTLKGLVATLAAYLDDQP